MAFLGKAPFFVDLEMFFLFFWSFCSQFWQVLLVAPEFLVFGNQVGGVVQVQASVFFLLRGSLVVFLCVFFVLFQECLHFCMIFVGQKTS